MMLRLGPERRRRPLARVLTPQHPQDAREALTVGGGHNAATTHKNTPTTATTAVASVAQPQAPLQSRARLRLKCQCQAREWFMFPSHC